LPSTSLAQDDRGVSAGGSASATSVDSRTSWSFAGSFEYRFNRVAGLELEATAVPTLKSAFSPVVLPASSTSSFFSVSGPAGSVTSSVALPAIFPSPRFENREGRALFFTNNVRLHIPTTAARLDPYFVAGGGIANVRRTAEIVFDFSPLIPTLPPGVVIPLPPSRILRQPFSSSSVDLALTIGGGVGVRAASRLWIEADLRLFRLMGEEDRNVGRFGAGVRYRF